MNEKENIIKVGYLVEVSVQDGRKVIWEVVDYHVVEETTDHGEIGLRGFRFNLFGEDEKVLGR